MLDTARPLRPGALTRLLEEIARAPSHEPAGWEVPLQPGEHVGRFEVRREIGRGGFGVVYEAIDQELGRSIALKAIRPREGAAAPDAGKLAEAEAAARLAHPNIVHLYDVGRCDRGAFLVMELLRGEPLHERVVRGPVPLREALRLATEIARGLAHAHANGVVHGDLKTANVFICDDGQVKVLDFGLARVLGRGGSSGGTPGYMAPEVAHGACDERSDVFAIGVMLHELCTGRRPAPPLADERSRASGVSVPGVPSQLGRLVARTLATDPADRPSSAVEVADALAAVQRSLENRRLWRAVSAAAAGVALLAGAAFALRPEPLPPGRLVVAIADVENTTGDAGVEPATAMLATALEQSPRLTLLPKARFAARLREQGGGGSGPLDERVALGAARELDAHVLIVPAVRRVGAGLEVAVRGIDTSRGDRLFTARERVGTAIGITAALDALSRRIRAELGEDRSQRQQDEVALAKAVSEKPEALRAYAEGMRLDSEGRSADATEAFERAVSADPEFSLAHAELARRAVWLDDEKAERHFDAALRGADRLPPKERLLLEASRAKFRYRIDDAITRWDTVIARWPQDPAAYDEAAFTLLYLLSDPGAARPYLEKAVELGMLAPPREIDALVALGRLDEALVTARRWTEESPGVRSTSKLSLVHRLRGEREAALDEARAIVSSGWLPGLSLPGTRRSEGAFWSYVEAGALEEVEAAFAAAGLRSWDALALQGRMREALLTFDEDSPSGAQWAGGRDAPPALRAVFHLLRGTLAWGSGDAPGVWQEVEEMFRLGSSAVACSAHMLAALGDTQRGARLAGLWSGFGDPRMYCPQLYRHVRDWKEGRSEDAARGLAAMYGPEPAYWLGVVLRDLGRDRDAIDAFRRFRRDPSWNTGPMSLAAYPRSLYFEAELLERLGDRAEALEVVTRLLRLWQRADADLPYLAEAKALHGRLAARSHSASPIR